MLQENLDKAKYESERNLKWTRSSHMMFTLHENHSSNKKGLRLAKVKTTYNPYKKYVDIPNNRICTHYGNNGTLRKHTHRGSKQI